MIVLIIALPKLLDRNNAKNIEEIYVSSSVADPWHFGTDLHPDLTPEYYFLKVHLHYFLKIKCIKKSQNSRNQGFSYLVFLLDDKRIQIWSRIRIHISY